MLLSKGLLHIAAQEAGVELSVADLYQAAQLVLQQQADFTLIEGAGGWRVPISNTEFSTLPLPCSYR